MINDQPVEGWTFVKWKDGSILIFSALLLVAAALSYLIPGIVTFTLYVIVFVMWLIVLYFFRNPSRKVIDEPGVVVGPCDGTVVEIAKEQETRYLNKEVTRISIFLSVFNVHVQRAPLAGRISLVAHQPGKYLQAYRPEASDVNEFIAMVVDTNYGKVLVKQISGILARRCVNYAQVDDEIKTGQRFGLIKFGSRVDLFLPPDGKVMVSIGDKVTGGITKMADLNKEEST